jgi:hypothetical protein
MDDFEKAQCVELDFFSHLLRLTEDGRKKVMQNVRREAPNLPDLFPLYVFARFHPRDDGVKLRNVWWKIEHFRGQPIPTLAGIEPLETKIDGTDRWIHLSELDNKGSCLCSGFLNSLTRG